MKIKIDIDCSPEEARTFLGLPDVGPMQKVVMDQLQAKMQDAAQSMDPQAMMKTWFPDASKGWEQWQKMFGAMGVPDQKDD